MAKKNLATKAATLPSFMKAGTRGSENVTMDDITIPRIEVVQALSPCRKKDKPEFIEGIQEGDLYNSVTREIYGDSVLIIPAFYRKSWLIWRDRDSGGGFKGSFDTPAEAKNAVAEAIAEVPQDDGLLDITDTPEFFILVVKEDGTLQEATLSLPKTKAKMARKLNSLIRLSEADSFAQLYELISVTDTNSKNQEYFNMDIKAMGWVSEEQYAAGEKMYESVKRGEKAVDRSDEVDTNTDAPSPEEDKEPF